MAFLPINAMVRIVAPAWTNRLHRIPGLSPTFAHTPVSLSNRPPSPAAAPEADDEPNVAGEFTQPRPRRAGNGQSFGRAAHARARRC